MKTKQTDKTNEINDFYKALGIKPKEMPSSISPISQEKFSNELKNFSIYTTEGYKFSNSSSTADQ